MTWWQDLRTVGTASDWPICKSKVQWTHQGLVYMIFPHFPLVYVCLCLVYYSIDSMSVTGLNYPWVWSQLHRVCFTGGFTTRVVKEYFHLDIARLLCRYLIYLSHWIVCFAKCVKDSIVKPYIAVNTNWSCFCCSNYEEQLNADCTYCCCDVKLSRSSASYQEDERWDHHNWVRIHRSYLS